MKGSINFSSPTLITARTAVAEELQKELISVENKAKILYNDVMRKVGGMGAREVGACKEQARIISDELLRLKDQAIQKAEEVLPLAAVGIENDAKVKNGSSNPNDLSCIIKKDLNFMLSLSPWDYLIGGTNIVTKLSDVYSALESAGGTRYDPKKNSASWVPPSSFERSTHKYWVDQKYIPDVMMKCVSNVPILIYGQGDDLARDQINQNPTSDVWNYISTTITSIYFDSPETMTLYKDRLARIQGAQLLRIRWYDQKPSPENVVFLELKTHHEKWIQNKSIKERVALRVKDVDHIFIRNKGVENTLTKDQAKNLILAATPQIDDRDLRDAIDLLLRIHYMIQEKNLRPRVRSTYRRVAFQSGTNNTLRFTLDRDVQLSSEACTLPESWCLDDDARVSAQSVTLPVAIFEVKLNGVDAPDWLNMMLNDSKIHDGYKFSKYLTGASVLFPRDIQAFPYWSSNSMFKNLYDDSEIDGYNLNRNGRESLTTTCTTKRFQNFLSKPLQSIWNKLTHRNQNDQNLAPRAISPKQKLRIEPKTYFAVERTFIQWISVSLLLVSMGTLLLTISTENSNVSAPHMSGIVLMCIATIITIYALIIYYRRLHLLRHGKTYGYTDHFAPIFLTLACLVGVSCILFYAVRDISEFGGSFSSSPIRVGSAYIPHSDECYRMDYTGVPKLSYRPSDITIDRGRNFAYLPSGDQITVLELDRMSRSRSTGRKSDHDHVHLVRVVARVRREDFKSVVWVKEGDVLFAVSKTSMLYAFQWEGRSTASNSIIGNRDGHDNHELMQMVGRWKLEEVMESTKGMAYIPPNDHDHGDADPIHGTSRFGTKNNSTDNGLFYIGTNMGHIHVFNAPIIEADTKEEDSFFHFESKNISSESLGASYPNAIDDVYEKIPPKLYSLYELNEKIVSFGTDTKIASMQIFEGVLFLLLNNALGQVVIRGYDVRSGAKVYEDKLPNISSNSDGNRNFLLEKQTSWGGMYLERAFLLDDYNNSSASTKAKSTTRSSFRGTLNAPASRTSASLLQLHMIQDDMPPAFWTFTMMVEKENNGNGGDIGARASPSSLHLPKCAAV